MNIQNLMNRNFTLMIVGQIISLFGNAILRFSLSLYVLDTTGSASAFGTILAVSLLPTILISPLGGMIADRFSRRHIMLLLDFLTSILIIGYSFFVQDTGIVIIGIVMVLLSLIQSFYQPAVQSSIPLLTCEENLMKANGIVVQVNALANLLGPILGSLLYTILPFHWLLWISGSAFFISAILECIMQIPFVKSSSAMGLLKTARHDLTEGMHFILHDNPVLWKLLLVLAGLNLVLSSLLTVGLPVISNITLALPASFYGWLQAGMGIGSIVGSILIPLFSKRFSISNSHVFLMLASISLIPISLALLLPVSRYMSYALVLGASIIATAFATIFNIYTQTFLQRATPNHLLGKVSSFVTMIVMCSYPLGQSLYGVLFEVFSDQLFLIVGIAILLSLMISFMARTSLRRIAD